MSSILLKGCPLLLLTALPAAANYPDETGYTRLKSELGAALPTGAGVGMTQVEGGPAGSYMPQAGTGTFAGTDFWTGKIFTAKHGATTFSDHAYRVAQYMYGDATALPTYNSSMCPGVVDVDGYAANAWAFASNSFLAPTAERVAPLVESRAVQNHSWIYDADPGEILLPGQSPSVTVNDLVRRQDFSIDRDNYVCCVGLNNGPASACPDLFAAAYNVISVGLTNGLHSRGGTTSDMDGPGRRKPEIVSPTDPVLSGTSFSTGYVSSAAGLLLEKASVMITNNARHTKTIKAVLLAGATKDEFPGWSKTTTHPIDAVFGAGELNIYNSYHILDGGEQPANHAAGRPYSGWDYHSLLAPATADYRLNIPAGTYGVELSAFLVWHRTLADSNNSPSIFTLAPNELANYNLTLFRDPAAGGAAVTIDSSNSTLYNLEHVWKKDLPAGNYRLRVSRTSGASQEFAIAWRLTTAPHQPQPEVTTEGNNFTFTFPGLLAGQPYKFQSSPDIATWTDIESFTATGPTATRVLARPDTSRLLYRLLPVLP